jgi:hypothetical protein
MPKTYHLTEGFFDVANQKLVECRKLVEPIPTLGGEQANQVRVEDLARNVNPLERVWDRRPFKDSDRGGDVVPNIHHHPRGCAWWQAG